MINAYTTSDNGSSNWERIRFYYASPANLDWMTIGVEGDSGDGTGGASWDDLRIYEVQDNGCRDNWYFDNTVFNYPFEFFQASNNIYVGNGVDPENGVNHIPGDVIIYAGTDVVLQAGNQVIIENMIMEPGSSRLALENKPCNDVLCPEELSFEDEILCEIPNLQIGTSPGDWGTSVSWSPTTHLENPNIANPIFTAPEGSGTVNYNVQVTYTCDGGFQYTSSYPVTVQYSDNNDPDAIISVTNVDWDVYNFAADFEIGEGVTEISISSHSFPGYNETFYVGEDFTCCNLSWELPDAWRFRSCHDDEIRVIVNNGCAGTAQEIVLDWPKSTIPFEFPVLPNVITPNGDGVNDELCFHTSSAAFYSITVINRWGNTMFESSRDIKDERFCTWVPEPNSVSDGTYFYELTVWDWCGNWVRESQNIQVVNDNEMVINDEGVTVKTEERIVNDTNNDTSFLDQNSLLNENHLNKINVAIFPNPVTDFIHIASNSVIKEIKILNLQGKTVYQTSGNLSKIDISALSIGTYLIEVYHKYGVKREKIVKGS